MTTRSIVVNLPMNNKQNFIYYSRKYEISSLRTLHVKNIIATHHGVCFKDSKIIKECVQAYPDKIKIFDLDSKLQFMTKPFKSYGGQAQYLLVHHPWMNYYHWLTESIPRIWLVRNKIGSLVLLLPTLYKSIQFVQDSLKPFKFKDIVYIPDGFNIKIKDAIIPQIKQICSNYAPDILEEIRAFYVRYAKSTKTAVPQLENKIYIKRGYDGRRQIINEDSVQDVLKKFNFSSINAMDYSFVEQILLSEKTHFLISNGSGLTNMHFMKPGTSVLELHKKLTNLNDFHDLVLWFMASGLKLDYFSCQCNPLNKEHDMYFANLSVDIKKFEKIVNCMLNKRN